MRKPLSSFSRRALLLASATPCAFPQLAAPQTAEKRFGERFLAARKQNPGFVERVRNQRGFPPEMNSLRWILGTWSAGAKAYATPSTPERVDPNFCSFILKTVPESGWIWGLNTREGSGVLMPLISYDWLSKRYVMDVCNYPGCYGVMLSPGLQADRIEFEGDVTIYNISLHMRQTFSKTSASDSEIKIFNEERMSNGIWTPIDEYYLKRQE